MRKVLSAYFGCLVFLIAGFLLFEGAVLKAASDSDSFDVLLEVTSEISVACDDGPHDLGQISGITGGTATSTSDVVCTVTTNNAAGYTMTVNATSTPAMTKIDDTGYSFADYAAAHEYHFGDDVAASESKYGFSASSTPGDMVAAWKTDNSGNCGSGNFSSNDVCFRGFDGANTINVINRSTSAPSGIDTEFRFLAKVGSTRNQESGNYKATCVVTVATN